MLECVPDLFKTRKMCITTVLDDPCILYRINIRTKIKAVQDNPWVFEYVPDRLSI